MKHILLSFISVALGASAFAQITITAADYGSAGDSIVVGYDEPTNAISIGGSGMQTWNFSQLSLNNINTLKFEDPANTASGNLFPDADLAIQRQSDTIFFQLNSAEFVIDGITGDGFGLGVSIVADFNPNSTQIEFPSTLNSSFVDQAVFDTTISCASIGYGSTCDSARLKRTLVATGQIDAYGSIQTPGGTYNSVRQYFRENNTDTVWAKLPFVGWQVFLDSQSVVHNYRWMANGEDWPVLSVVADAQNGNIVTAEYKVDENVLGFVASEINPSCKGECDGSASVSAVGGQPPYSYAWPVSAGSQTTASATGLCAGTYTVTISDQNAGSYEVDIELTEPNAISIAGAVQGVSVGADGAIDITVSGGAGSYTYDWSGPDGYTATTEDIANIEIGDYTVIVGDANGCDTSRTFTVDLTGISNLGTGGYKAFPNPADGAFTITSTNLLGQVRVMDLLGNIVYSNTPEVKQLTIETANLAPGIYVIEVETVQGFHLSKINVQH